MSQLTIFTGKRQTGQTSRLVDAIIEKAKTHRVVCHAHDSATAKELLAKIQLKMGVSANTEIPNICVFNTGHAAFFKANEHIDPSDSGVTEEESTHTYCIAFDDVPLERLAWLTEWSASANIHVLASHCSDAEFKMTQLTQVVELPTYKLLQQLGTSVANMLQGISAAKVLSVLNEINIGQSFIVVNVEDCAITFNITDPRKSDHVFAANSKLTPGVKFEVIRLTETTWQLGIAKEQ